MGDFEKQKQEIDKIFNSIENTKASLEKKSYDGTRDVLKYFDRIHDKLFTFNNIMIAGFFAIAKIKDNVPMALILVPIINLIVIIFIEYKMMEKSRMEANILEDNFNIDKHGKAISNTNNYSLLTIFTTAIVTAFFLYNLFK
ncbi:hypothetical protein HZQ56_18050 [Elizabethkingia anophelis]|nr:hypothetical protein [Elizabethkingia anophelis]MCT3875083.1 hypothetical protein [Elizabethkingia anophelis]